MPIGTGPFKVVRWVRGDHIELVANDDYFRGKPKLSRIIVREIPDENTSVNALRAHDVDWIFELSEQYYRQVKGIPNVVVILQDKPQTLQAGQHVAPAARRPARAPRDRVRDRQAVAGRQEYVRHGAGRVGRSAAVRMGLHERPS
jgi:peptide/nickel transport system substrate-binding protein